MGLGKTITCVSLMASTLQSARRFGISSLDPLPQKPKSEPGAPDVAAFSGAVWGMPDVSDQSASANKNKAKLQREHERQEALYARACRLKVKSRATLIICPLSTVANWEDQFKEHWKGEVVVVGGAGNCPGQTVSSSRLSPAFGNIDGISESPSTKPSNSEVLRIYIYHGNSRRPDPAFLSDFDVVITTFSTLASEYSKQNRAIAAVDEEDPSSDGGFELDEHGGAAPKSPKKRAGVKRKKCSNGCETASALQSVHWFRVVLDEAQ
jgi:SWI/SNF-related matrix-associated actin-dependent regulator of chromatin subfamily A3